MNPAGLLTVQQGHLAALEDYDAHDVPTWRRRIALWIVVLVVLAAAALAWFTGLVT